MNQLRSLCDDSMESELFFRPLDHSYPSICLDSNNVHVQAQSVTRMKDFPFNSPMTLQVNADLSCDVKDRGILHRFQLRFPVHGFFLLFMGQILDVLVFLQLFPVCKERDSPQNLS